VNGGEFARYLNTGYVTYLDTKSGVLMAAPFSASSMEVTGAAVRVAEGIARSPSTSLADYDASLAGDLVFLPGSAGVLASFAWVTRDGVTRTLPIKPQTAEQPRLSHDGKRLIARVGTGVGEQTDLWEFDLVRGTPLRLTFEPSESETALWTRDDTRIFFSGSRPGRPRTIFSKASDAGSPETVLATNEHLMHLTSLSPDGKSIAFTQFPAGSGDILILDLSDASGKPAVRPLIQTQYNEYGAVFSPNGQWIAYTSNQGTTDQVFVQAYPGPGPKYQVSTDGGSEPVWSRTGHELYYRHDDKMMVVPLTLTPVFKPGAPAQLFEGRFERAHRSDANYDVAPDGRFLMIKSDQQATPQFINVLMSLPELRAKK
jgi:serine/threonine-protein kinase